MNIPKELIEQLSDDILKELQEKSRQTGKPLTFDDMEEAVLMFRQRLGEDLMQHVVDKQEEDQHKKKTAVNAVGKSKEKVLKRRKS